MFLKHLQYQQRNIIFDRRANSFMKSIYSMEQCCFSNKEMQKKFGKLIPLLFTANHTKYYESDELFLCLYIRCRETSTRENKMNKQTNACLIVIVIQNPIKKIGQAKLQIEILLSKPTLYK